MPEAAKPHTVLTKAVLRTANLLGLTRESLARVIGIETARIAQLEMRKRAIAPESKAGELGLLLIRAYRPLDALVGGHAAQRKAWMNGYNRALNVDARSS